MSGVLQCQDLTVRYAGNVALSSVSIGVPAGKMVGLVGANGAGKSTLV
ncbi:MAG: ATP-binding cassette domain-containing protein, partial [Bradyrhizobium sp.]|nr:ATP-binding cassette domain-containing protein [Bradyrhizobium sp.]